MSFANFTGEISDEIHQMEGHLEMTKFEIAFENFSHLRNFNLGRPPMRIRPQKKNLFVFFHHLFSTIQGSAFPNPTSFRARLQPLDHPFKCAFEPSFFFLLLLGQVTHYNETLSFFYLGRSPITIRPFSLYLSKKNNFLVLFFIGQVAWNNQTTRENPFRVLLFLSGRSPGTIRPLAKPFLRFFYYRAGCPKEFDPFFIKKKQQKKQQKVSRLPNDLFLDFYISL